MRKLLVAILIALLLPTGSALAVPEANPQPDPTVATQAVYGALTGPNQVNYYSFTAGQAADLPIQVLVPVSRANAEFRPAVAISGPGIPASGIGPENQSGLVWNVIDPEQGNGFFFEHATAESFFNGATRTFHLAAGATYYVAIYAPDYRTGEYVLGLGAPERISYDDLGALAKRVATLKLGLYPGRHLPWGDFTGTLLLLIGLIGGVGSAVVLMVTWGRRIITQPLITLLIRLGWGGLGLTVLGLAVLYRHYGSTGVGTLQELFPYLAVLGWLYLSVYVARPLSGIPRVTKSDLDSFRRRALTALAVVMVGWGFELALTAWYLVVTR